MRLTEKYSVTWEYHKVKLHHTKLIKETVTTTCYLYDDELEAGTIGTVQWYTKDPFSKEIARKQSLKKAIARMNIGKEARRSIWQGYLSRKFRPAFPKDIIKRMKEQKRVLNTIIQS